MTISQTGKSNERPAAKLPEGYTIRPIETDDYERGVLKTLATLTTVGEISKPEFANVIKEWASHGDTYTTLVIVDGQDQVVGVGSIIIELKLIHACAKIGHIEDISIRGDQQGKKLGLLLIQSLTKIGEEKGCYKVILDCDPKNKGFYEKCGYQQAGLEMDIRF
ncbi:unnamed protein product [Ambrosiozyma monospora]|uniref:Glucosamine 6-phosphate N-acetyltransferase n=1 Tax=Ambrosiozyma monospora TaxID=43982 RepID=A0A9W6Z231_AMBMO|nr:unnamed protein product [Ambrosiozyma monospora]